MEGPFNFQNGLVSRSVDAASSNLSGHKMRRVSWLFGAGDGIRTRDIDLGKVALYQLSYSRTP